MTILENFAKDNQEKSNLSLQTNLTVIMICNQKALTIKKIEKNVQVESFLPEVVEPSFGIGRIFTVVTEHNFNRRAADGRRFFTFPPSISPFKFRDQICRIKLNKKIQFFNINPGT